MKPSNEKLLTENCRTRANKNVEMVPPDGGWGWIVVLGSIILMILGAFPLFAFSIIFSPILMQKGVSSVKIAWIFNLHLLMYSLYTLFVGPLCEEFGHRKVAFIGGVIVSLSVILSAFAPSVDFLFLSYGLLGGIGGCSTLSICFLIVPKYFTKKRGLALGLTFTGGCGSSFLAPILTSYLLQYYDYKGASLIFSAIVLNQCVGAMFYQPVEWHLKPTKVSHTAKNKINEKSLLSEQKNSDEPQKQDVELDSTEDDTKFNASSDTTTQKNVLEKLLKEERNCDKNNSQSRTKEIFLRVIKSAYNNFKSLKYMRVLFISLAACGVAIGYTNFQMWIPFIVTNAGYSIDNAAWCSSIASTGNITGRLTSSLLADRKFFSKRYGYIFGAFLMGSCIIVFTFLQDISLFITVGFIWGFGVGLTVALMVTVMIDVMGMKMLPAVLGVSQLSQGVLSVVVGTIVGAVRDATSSYRYASWIIAGCAYFGSGLWLLMPLAEKYDKKKYKEDEEEIGTQNC